MFVVRQSHNWSLNKHTKKNSKPLKNMTKFGEMFALGKLFEILYSSAIYVMYGLGIGCLIETIIMPKLYHLTRRIDHEKARASANLILQTSFTAFFAECLKILMNNKGSPGAISLGAAIFVMQKSFNENVKILKLC